MNKKETLIGKKTIQQKKKETEKGNNRSKKETVEGKRKQQNKKETILQK